MSLASQVSSGVDTGRFRALGPHYLEWLREVYERLDPGQAGLVVSTSILPAQ